MLKDSFEGLSIGDIFSSNIMIAVFFPKKLSENSLHLLERAFSIANDDYKNKKVVLRSRKISLKPHQIYRPKYWIEKPIIVYERWKQNRKRSWIVSIPPHCVRLWFYDFLKHMVTVVIVLRHFQLFLKRIIILNNSFSY